MRKVFAALAIVGVIVAGAFAWRAHIVNELRKPVLERLSDPDSAKFRNEWLATGWSAWRAESSILCGEVNAKNRMGGYVGYVKFSSVAGGNDVDIGNDELGLKMVDIACATGN